MFISPNSKIYAVLAYIAKIFVINIFMLAGIVSVVGLSLSLQLIRHYLDGGEFKVFFGSFTIKKVLLSGLFSIASYIIIGLASVNFYFLQDFMRFLYSILFFLISYMIVLIHLYQKELQNRELTLSHCMYASFMNYPKFIFFASILSAVAYLLLDGPFFVLVLMLYMGAMVYAVYASSKKTCMRILDGDKDTPTTNIDNFSQ